MQPFENTGGRMRRFLLFSVVCFIVFAPPTCGWRQAAAQDAAPATTPEQLVAETPVLATLSQIDPQKATEIAIRILRIGENRQQDTVRDGSIPTAPERAQIAANPAFANAYNLNPGLTLGLLRQVNRDIAGSHGG